MNKVIINIWNREFELEVSYDCFDDEELLQTQKDAVAELVKHRNCIVESESKVKEYCLCKNAHEIGTGTINNIFKYVMPQSLFVVRNETKRIVAIMCDYKFDMEHGLAVVFENEQFKIIGEQDIIL